MSPCPFHRTRVLIATLMLLVMSSQVRGQIENPVYVDDSPQAWELFRQAQDQARNNAGEAVRLFQELLDEFGLKLIPVSEASPEHFTSVRARVNAALLADAELLQRYRLIQSAPADQLLDAGELEQVVQTRLLTEAGLEAALRLAQASVEAGHFHSALSWLANSDGHPDLIGRRAAHRWVLAATAWQYLGQPARAREALDQLAALSGDELAPVQHRTEIEALQQQALALVEQRSIELPQPVSTLDYLPQSSTDDLHDLVAQAIWSVPLENSLAQRRMTSMREDPPLSGMTAPVMEQRGRDADLATAVPTIVDEVVYVNEGHTVRALHRLTGKQLWTYNNLVHPASTDREVQVSLDLNVVAVAPGPGGAIVTLTGYAQPNSRSESGRVICLNAEDGSWRWSASLSGVVDAAATHEQLFPHGSPVIVDDMVFVAARRVSMQAITSAYVVALDLASGQPRWVRYITSTGGLQARIRPFCSLVQHEGSLYISSAVGAMARIVPQTGETQWLVRFSTPITSGYAEQTRRPWEIGGPVVTHRGVITIEPDQRRVVLLDRQTGSRLENYIAGPGTAWNLPRYLLADDQRVYAIGMEIRAFDLEHLGEPLWVHPSSGEQQSPLEQAPGVRPGSVRNQNQPADRLAPAASFELRGRVQVVPGSLIAPTSEGVLVIDSETGLIRNHLPVEAIGNPLAHESQLLLASGSRLDAYMSFSKAERMLRDRIAQTPTEPEPALSLLRLGMRVRNLPLALEAAEMAQRAIDRMVASGPTGTRASEMRSELLNLLLELAAEKVAQTQAEGELVFAAISAAAIEPVQRVEFLLAYGQWLSDHALARSVEAFQTILSDRNLAEAWRAEGGLMRPASAWARERLAALIASRGAAVYAPQADFASIRLRQLTAAGEPDPAALRALAQEFPFADAAIDASLQAATLLQQRGDVRGAAAALAAAYLATPSPAAAEQLLGRLHSLAAASGQHALAQDIMQHVLNEHGDIALQQASGSVSPRQWLETNAPADRPFALRPAIIGDQHKPAQPIAGSLAQAHRHLLTAGIMPGSQLLPADRALLRIGNAVRLLGTQSMDPLWTTTLEDQSASPEILRMEHRGILLWLGSEASACAAIMLEPDTGAIRWTAANLRQHLAQPPSETRDVRRLRDLRHALPDGEPFDPRTILPLVNDQHLIVVQRNGSVAALDLAHGRTIRWRREQSLEQVHFAALHASALVLAGLARDVEDGGELVARLVLLDPGTGQPLFEQTAALQHIGRGAIKWLRINPLGVLVYATPQGVHALNLYTGRRIWSNSSYEALELQRAWLLDNRLLVEDQRNMLRTVNLADGSISEAFESPARGEWDPLELKNVMLVNGRVATHYPQRIVVYNPHTGDIEGADMITDDRDYRFLTPTQDRFVLISGRTMQAPVPDQPTRRTQRWSYRLYDLSENCMVLGDPVELEQPLNERVQQVIAIDHWLLLSTQNETLAIPRPAAP